MNNQLKLIFTAAFAFGLGIGMNNFAMSDVPSTFKVAVVDVPKVVVTSSQVKALKAEQAKKADALQKWIATAQADVKKQSTDEGKKKLIKKYDDELRKKQRANSDEYVKKLTEIDKNIGVVINQKAKEQGYNLVLAKGLVLYGGDDITDTIAKTVKQ